MDERTSRPYHARQDKRQLTPPGSPRRSTRQISTHPRGAANAARTDLFTTTAQTGRDSKPKTAALNIATAQRLVLADLQHDIALRAEAVLGDSADPTDIERLGSCIKKYCKFVSPDCRCGGSRLTNEQQAKLYAILNTCKNAQLAIQRTTSATRSI